MFSTQVQNQPGDDTRFLADAARLFPHIAVERNGAAGSRFIEDREVGGFPIARVDTPRTSIHTSSQRAVRHGMADHFKFFWQLSGSTRVEDADRTVRLSKGDAILLSLSSTYQLDMEQDACGLILIFNPTSSSLWREASFRHQGKIIGMNGASAAASAGIAALLIHGRGNRTEALAVQGAIDLLFASLEEEDGGKPIFTPRPVQLRRAALLVEQNLADPDYGPERLARDLGLSRRTLYNRFAELGMTPADFIRGLRLQSARADIARDQDNRLDMIALRNGFTDGSSFSHAFKAAYGVSPSRLRPRRKLI